MPDTAQINDIILKKAIDEAFSMLGHSATKLLFDLLMESDILTHQDGQKGYSLDMIRRTLVNALGNEAAEAILIKINQITNRQALLKGTSNFREEESILADKHFGAHKELTGDDPEKLEDSTVNLTLTSTQVNYLYSAISNMIGDIEDLDSAREKFGGRGEYYIHELRQNLPALQKILFEILAKERVVS